MWRVEYCVPSDNAEKFNHSHSQQQYIGKKKKKPKQKQKQKNTLHSEENKNKWAREKVFARKLGGKGS